MKECCKGKTFSFLKVSFQSSQTFFCKSSCSYLDCIILWCCIQDQTFLVHGFFNVCNDTTIRYRHIFVFESMHELIYFLSNYNQQLQTCLWVHKCWQIEDWNVASYYGIMIASSKKNILYVINWIHLLIKNHLGILSRAWELCLLSHRSTHFKPIPLGPNLQEFGGVQSGPIEVLQEVQTNTSCTMNKRLKNVSNLDNGRMHMFSLLWDCIEISTNNTQHYHRMNLINR